MTVLDDIVVGVREDLALRMASTSLADIEAAALLAEAGQGAFTVVAERWMAEVVGKAGGINNVWVAA